MKTFTVSYLKRFNVTVEADDLANAIKLACPWWSAQQPPDGNVLLGVTEGPHPIENGYKTKPDAPKPPSAPTPGTPVLEHLAIRRAA